jgi:hypothetical protein
LDITLGIQVNEDNMAIVVREALDDDLPRAVEIESAAYADNPLSPVLFPSPFPPEAREQRVPGLIEMREQDPTVRFMQAYDEETEQLVAFAKWHVYDTPVAAAAAQRPSRSFGPGTNKEACEDFFGKLSSKKRELMGDRPHLCMFRPRIYEDAIGADTNRSPYASYRSSFSGTRCRRNVGGVGHEESG